MNFGQGERLRALQERYSDPLLTLLTALLLLMMFVVAPLQAAGIIRRHMTFILSPACG